MRSLKVIILIITGIILFSSAVQKVQKSAGPPSCHAGEPPNNTNCTSCHNDGIVNTGSADVSLSLGGAESGYEPGKKYTITISVQKPGLVRSGFQCIALTDQDIKTSPGQIAFSGNRIQRVDKNASHPGDCLDEERVWMEHTFEGLSGISVGTNSWSYEWTAPASDVGTITFYLAAIEANNDLNETGDQCYTRKVTISALPVGVRDIEKQGAMSVFSDHINKELKLRYTEPVNVSARLYNSSGTTVMHWESVAIPVAGASLKVDDVAPGVYYLEINLKAAHYVRKVVIL